MRIPLHVEREIARLSRRIDLLIDDFERASDPRARARLLADSSRLCEERSRILMRWRAESAR